MNIQLRPGHEFIFAEAAGLLEKPHHGPEEGIVISAAG